MQRRYLKMGVSAVCTIVFSVSLIFAFLSTVFLLSAFFSRTTTFFFFQNKQWKILLRLSLPRRAVVNISRTTCGKLLVELLSLEQTRGVIVLFVEEVELAQIAPSYHFALDLLWYKEGDHHSA